MGNNSNDDNSKIIDTIATNQLERYHRNKIIDKDLNELESNLQCVPIDKQLAAYEEFTKKLVIKDEIIRDYIYRTALDKHFNMISTIASMPNSIESMLTNGENIGRIKYLIDDEIRENGEEYLYFKKHRKELLAKYASGIPPWIKSVERFHNLGAIIQDLAEFLNTAGPIDQIRKIKVFKAKMSHLFPEDEMEVKHAEDIPSEIKRFNSLMDKIEELENKMKKPGNVTKHKPVSINTLPVLLKILNWNSDKSIELFVQILENLKDDIIRYNDIDHVLSTNEKVKFIGSRILFNAAYLFEQLNDKTIISLPKINKYKLITDNFDFDIDKSVNIIKRLKDESVNARTPPDSTTIQYCQDLYKKIFHNTTI